MTKDEDFAVQCNQRSESTLQYTLMEIIERITLEFDHHEIILAFFRILRGRTMKRG